MGAKCINKIKPFGIKFISFTIIIMKIKEIKIDDITLGDYQKIMIKEDVKEEDFLKCFLKLTQKELNKLTQAEVDVHLSDIKTFLESEPELTTNFKLNGVNYGFIPKLDDITYGENLDITKYIGEYGSMHKAMAVLYRPISQRIGDRYLIEEYTSSYIYAEKLREMPLRVALGALVFFYNLTNELLSYTLRYLKQEIVTDSALRKTLQENGTDILNSIRSLKETLHDLIESPN